MRVYDTASIEMAYVSTSTVTDTKQQKLLAIKMTRYLCNIECKRTLLDIMTLRMMDIDSTK
jgi:hypothetical protein